MNPALLEGLGMGILLSVMIGPVFFALIENSLLHGFRHSMVMALGILFSDLIYVGLTYFGIRLLIQNPYFEIILGYMGSLVLIGLGVATLIHKNTMRPNSGGLPAPRARKRLGFFKGFSINGMNPFVLLFWISIASLVQLKDQYLPLDVFLYYFGILFTVFSSDLLKAYIAKQLRPLITPKLMLKLNRGVAVLLIIFGSSMLKYALDKHLLLY